MYTYRIFMCLISPTIAVWKYRKISQFNTIVSFDCLLAKVSWVEPCSISFFSFFFFFGSGTSVRSTSYIDEPDSTSVRDNVSTLSTPSEPPATSTPVAADQHTVNGLTPLRLDQSYLNLIDDSACQHHVEEQECSADEGSILFSVGPVPACLAEPGAVESEQRRASTMSSELVAGTSTAFEEKLLCNGHALKNGCPPPDIVLETLPSNKTVPRCRDSSLGLSLDVTQPTWPWTGDDQETDASRPNGRSEVKHGPSRTRQRNVCCQETEV